MYIASIDPSDSPNCFLACLREAMPESPLDTLPTELISAILIQGLPKIGPGPTTYRRYVSTSCAVNRRLRTIAINTPPLWTRISFHNPNDLCLTIEMIEHSLTRSGVLPLDISVHLMRAGRYLLANAWDVVQLAARLLKSNYHRAKTIWLEFGDHVNPTDFLPLSGTGLESVTLCLPNWHKDDLNVFVDACAPTGLRILNSNTTFKINTERLSHLHFSRTADLSFVQKCHTVEWLKLDDGADTFDGVTKLSLPRARVMIIGGPIGELLIQAPSLEHLTMAASSPWVSCDFPNLRTITISDHSVLEHLDQTKTIVAIRALDPLPFSRWLLRHGSVITRLPNLRLVQIQLEERSPGYPLALACTIREIARSHPTLTIEVLNTRPASVDYWVDAYEVFEPLKNVAISYVRGDLEERFHAEHHGH